MKKYFILFLGFLTACMTVDPYTREQKVSNSTKGAVIGAASGAIIGGVTHKGKGAVIGGLAGAAGGALVGNYMDTQSALLRQELEGTGVSVQKYGNKINLIMPGNITFNSNSSDIKDSFKPTLNSIAKVINKYNKTIVTITGHTDSTGTNARNDFLSLERANSVSNYLKVRGVSGARINTYGKGSKNPIASNSTSYGREQNRRVEIELVEIQK